MSSKNRPGVSFLSNAWLLGPYLLVSSLQSTYLLLFVTNIIIFRSVMCLHAVDLDVRPCSRLSYVTWHTFMCLQGMQQRVGTTGTHMQAALDSVRHATYMVQDPACSCAMLHLRR